MRKQLQERPAERTACHDTETHCIAVKAAPATARADQRAHQYRCDAAANEHRGGNDAVGGRFGRSLCRVRGHCAVDRPDMRWRPGLCQLVFIGIPLPEKPPPAQTVTE